MGKRYKRSQRVFWRQFKDNVVAINHETNEIILLNPTGSAIWLFMGSPRAIRDICMFPKNEYKVKDSIVREDVDVFLSSLISTGFIEEESRVSSKDLDENFDSDNTESSSVKYEVMQWAARNIIPISVHIEITKHCNLHCAHCYLSHRNMNFLSLPSFETILQQLKDAGTLLVTLTGGEPFLHPDFVSFLDIAILKYAFSVSFFTNGTVKQKDWKAIMERYSFREIHVSLYSLQPDIHDRITGVEGSHLSTLDFISQLCEKGIRVVIKSPLFEQTIEEASSLRKYAKAMGAEWSGGPLITPRDNGDMLPTAMRATPEQITSYFQKVEENSLSAKAHILEDVFHSSRRESPLACLALSNSCFIDVNGDLYPCSQLRRKIGNVVKTSFCELWTKSSVLSQLREIRFYDLKECSSCKLSPHCSRCPGIADLEGRDLLGPSPFDCILAQSRKKAEELHRMKGKTIIA